MARHWPDAQGAARPQRVHAVPEQHLGAVDVADPGDHLLVEQQVADGPLAAGDPRPRAARVRVVAQRVRAEAVDHRGTTRGRDQLADDGAAQVGVRPNRREPQAYLSHRRGHLLDPGADVELADQAEVDVHDPFAGELAEQVLARGLRADEHGAVDQGRRLGEAVPADC